MATQTWETGLLPSGVEGWLSKITLPSGDEYLIRDDASRTKIQEILNDLKGGVVYSGKLKTPLTDGATTATVTKTDDSTVTLTADDAGALFVVDKTAYSPEAKQDKEFIWNGTSWDEFGSVGALKTLAYMDPSDIQTASAVVTDTSVDVTGTITGPTITQGSDSSTYKYLNPVTVVTDTSVDVTGTITAPTITQGSDSSTYKYLNPVTVVTDTSVDVTGTITGPTITQGADASTYKYIQSNPCVTGVDNAVKINTTVSNETLVFATTTPTYGTAVTENNSEYTVTTAEPADWASNYTRYYTKSGDVYSAVTGATAPTWAANTYYAKGDKVATAVSIGNPTSGNITVSAGTLTDTLTATKVGIEQKPVTP